MKVFADQFAGRSVVDALQSVIEIAQPDSELGGWCVRVPVLGLGKEGVRYVPALRVPLLHIVCMSREMAGDEHHSDTSEVDVDRNCSLFPPNQSSKSPNGLLVDFQFFGVQF